MQAQASFASCTALMSALVLSVFSGSTLGQANPGDAAIAAAVLRPDETVTVARDVTMPVLAVPPTSPALGNSRSSTWNSQTMLWVRHQRLSAGVGVERRSLPTTSRLSDNLPSGSNDAALMVGMGVNLGSASSNPTRLSWQAPIATTTSNASVLGETLKPQARVGLSFASQDRFAALRRAGALKVELTSQTAVAFKPRRGKFNVTLMSQW